MKIKLSESEISQEIDLEEMLGRMPTQAEAKAFIDSATEYIIERTQSGKDINGKDFKPYTKDYADEKGVGRGEVDLTLFGDMLDAVQGEFKNGIVKLSITGEEAVKAYAHMTGFKGHPTIPNGKYKRKFFGLSDSDIDNLSIRSKKELSIGDIIDQIGLKFEKSKDSWS